MIDNELIVNLKNEIYGLKKGINKLSLRRNKYKNKDSRNSRQRVELKKLQQENKELKEQLKLCKEFNEGLKNNIKKLNDVLARMPLEKTLMQCEIYIYKSRIDKAIEYMKNYIEVESENEPVKIEFGEVLNILEGDKK